MVTDQDVVHFPEDQATQRTCTTDYQRPPRSVHLEAVRDVQVRHITPLDDLFFWNSFTFTDSVLGDHYGPSITQSR